MAKIAWISIAVSLVFLPLHSIAEEAVVSAIPTFKTRTEPDEHPFAESAAISRLEASVIDWDQAASQNRAQYEANSVRLIELQREADAQERYAAAIPEAERKYSYRPRAYWNYGLDYGSRHGWNYGLGRSGGYGGHYRRYAGYGAYPCYWRLYCW